MPLTSVDLGFAQDIEHKYRDAKTAYNSGSMNGYNNEYLSDGKTLAGTFPYAYVNPTQVAPYWDIAKTWVLGDNFYPTEWGPSFTAHLNIIAGTSQTTTDAAVVDFPSNAGPWGCDAIQGTVTSLLKSNGNYLVNQGPFPCFTQFHTLADTMDLNGVSWRYYAPKPTNWANGGIWSSFDAISAVRNGPDWSNVISPPWQIFDDIDEGILANVTWVIPDWKNSDHAGSRSDSGPSWVASVVNKVGLSSFWNTTAIVIVWDDWGGWYDGVPPPQLDFRGLGLRTPLLVLSPYAIAGQGSGSGLVSHYQFEPGSILKFIENTFNLSTLANKYGKAMGYTDSRATGIGVTLNMNQARRPFAAIPAKYSQSYFQSQQASAVAPDDDQ